MFDEEDTNPEARAPMPAEVIDWVERHARAVRHYKRPPEVIAAADDLVTFARGGS